MTEDLQLIQNFLESDKELKENLRKNFNMEGELSLPELTNEIIKYISRRLNFSDSQYENIVYSKNEIYKLLINNYIECSENYCSEVDNIKVTSDELIENGSINENTQFIAERHCKRLYNKLDELISKNFISMYSNSSFSNCTVRCLGMLRIHMYELFGSDITKKYDYFCESELKNIIDDNLCIILHTVAKRSYNDMDEMTHFVRNFKSSLDDSGKKEALGPIL